MRTLFLLFIYVLGSRLALPLLISIVGIFSEEAQPIWTFQ